jgi:hypothetical protein
MSLCVISPAVLGAEYYRESAALVNAAAGGPPDRAKMAEIMRRSGLTMVAPTPQSSAVIPQIGAHPSI